VTAETTAILTPTLREEFDALCGRYPQRRAAILPILHRVQDQEGWISKQAMEEVADYLEMPPVEVWGVVSFYPMFRRSPGGRHHVSVCKNISCDLLGCREVFAQIEKRFGVRPGETTDDGAFSLHASQCLGACGYGPMLDLDGEYHENLTPESAVKLLEDLS